MTESERYRVMVGRMTETIKDQFRQHDMMKSRLLIVLNAIEDAHLSGDGPLLELSLRIAREIISSGVMDE